MIRLLLPLIILVCAAMPARAARSYENCTGFIDTLPATVSARGTWCLRANLDTAQTAGGAITVQADHVVIDCNDHRLGGLGAGLSTYTSGVVTREASRHNVTVRNCTIVGFRYGIALLGFSHLVEDNVVEAATFVGIATRGDNNVVQRNIVRDTGGQPGATNAYGITMFGRGGLALENSVLGVDAGPPGAQGGTYAYGISLQGGIIQRNRVVDMQFIGVGIAGFEAPMILDNVVYRGSAESGVAISGGNGVCEGNQIDGWEFHYLSCRF